MKRPVSGKGARVGKSYPSFARLLEDASISPRELESLFSIIDELLKSRTNTLLNYDTRINQYEACVEYPERSGLTSKEVDEALVELKEGRQKAVTIAADLQSIQRKLDKILNHEPRLT